MRILDILFDAIRERLGHVFIQDYTLAYYDSCSPTVLNFFHL